MPVAMLVGTQDMLGEMEGVGAEMAEEGEVEVEEGTVVVVGAGRVKSYEKGGGFIR